METERKKILQMVADKKISATEAEELLDALATGSGAPVAETPAAKPKPRFLIVKVEDGEGAEAEKVNMKIPLQILRAGIKFANLIPTDVREKVDGALKTKHINVDLSHLTAEGMESLIDGLSDFTVDVKGKDREMVKIYCE